jgi:tol-pal system protein YbgF
MKLKYWVSFICLAGISGCMPPNGQVTYLDQRVAQLERQNAAMAADLKKSEQALNQVKQDGQELRGQSAEFYASIEAIRQELRSVTGKAEETAHILQKGRLNASEATPEKEDRLSRVEEMNHQNAERIAKVEQYLNLEVTSDAAKRSSNLPEKSALTATPPSTLSPAPTPQGKKELAENELYESAKQAFDKGEFETARDQFVDYLKRFPKAKNADNAQFWIGEIYYRDKWYEKAIMEYQKVIENFPDGNKVPAALLKQGLAFVSLNEKPNAKIILQEIIRKYPTSNEAKIAKEKLSAL